MRASREAHDRSERVRGSAAYWFDGTLLVFDRLDLSELSRAATLRGIALLVPLQKRLGTAKEPTDHEFREVREA